MQNNTYLQLIRFDKPIGTLLLWWPCLTAMWLANAGYPSLKTFLTFSFGVFIMRSAGCIINDIADKNIDNHVNRTKNRPLANKKLELKSALIILLFLLFLALLLMISLPIRTWIYACIALAITTIYPLMKRITYYPQVILGIAFSWSIIMVFSAIQKHIPITAWLLFYANILWTISYDTIYALMDREEDLKIGVKSTAIKFMYNETIMLAILLIISVILLLLIGIINNFNLLYYTIIIIGIGSIFGYQLKIVKQQLKLQYLCAFKSNNWVGMLLWLSVLCQYYNNY